MIFFHMFLNFSKFLETAQRVAAYVAAFYTDDSKLNKIWYQNKTNKCIYVDLLYT